MNIIITGATKGIGRAISERFAKEGFNLAICSRNAEDLKAFKNELNSQHPDIQILTKKCDVSKKRAVQSLAAFVLKKWDRIDILVNNAGLAVGLEPIHEGVVDDWERMIDTNGKGLLYISREISPWMGARKKGHIINIASIAGKDGNPNASAYSASKAAVIGLTKSLGKELAESGVTANAIAPAAVRTAIFEQMTQAHIDFMLSKIQIGRASCRERV